MNYPQKPQPQQQSSVNYEDALQVSDTSGLPDGQYQLELVRVEKYQGTRFQSDEPQDKLRFAFRVLSGPAQGKEAWNIENLPDAGKNLGPKAGLRKFLDLLRGKPLVDGEQVQPASLVGTQGYAQLAGGKFRSFVPMAVPEAGQQQSSDVF